MDKIIGSIYPLFGALLILGTFAIFAVLMFHAAGNPALLSESEAFRANMLTPANNSPILPMLFVTIACGILSASTPRSRRSSPARWSMKNRRNRVITA